jgi:hypothetical protein
MFWRLLLIKQFWLDYRKHQKIADYNNRCLLSASLQGNSRCGFRKEMRTSSWSRGLLLQGHVLSGPEGHGRPQASHASVRRVCLQEPDVQTGKNTIAHEIFINLGIAKIPFWTFLCLNYRLLHCIPRVLILVLIWKNNCMQLSIQL